jgi:hypothetical protein
MRARRLREMPRKKLRKELHKELPVELVAPANGPYIKQVRGGRRHGENLAMHEH